MTEHPTSYERPQPGADPAEARGALLRTPQPPPQPQAAPLPLGATALPAQARAGETPSGPGTSMSKEHSVNGPEHAQPTSAEPDPHRPRPTPEGIPPQPGAEQERVA
ncbi:serine/threonine protein phosphatase, partial [Streptomyces sp. NPDC048279]